MKIKIIGLEDFGKKSRETFISLINTPVPLGKTVITTVIVMGLTQIVILRKFKTTFIISRK